MKLPQARAGSKGGPRPICDVGRKLFPNSADNLGFT